MPVKHEWSTAGRVMAVIVGLVVVITIIAVASYDPKAAREREKEDARVACSYNVPPSFNQTDEMRKDWVDMCAEMTVTFKNVNRPR